MPKQPKRSSRKDNARIERSGRQPGGRLIIFAGICVVCLIAVGVVVINASRRVASGPSPSAADAPASSDVLSSVAARPHLVFLHSPTGDQYRQVAIVPLDAPDGPRYLTPLQCQRVYFQAQQGLCLGNNYVGGKASSYNAFSFDERFNVGATYDEAGTPIRVRLSNDGELGAMTVFVTGHSYADFAFSTLTNLVDATSGQVITDMEKFNVERDGAPFQSVDFNFWGVTFARDRDHFYATLGTGGKTYLIEGTLSTRGARVIMENVECPSLSPDNTRIAFKQRSNSDARQWQLMVLDLSSMTVAPIPGETRSIDDQVEWLDDNHILYATQQEGSLATDIWEGSLNGAEQPHIFVRQGLSPAVVR